MAIGTIPIPRGSYDFKMRINLGDSYAQLRIYYNTRASLWHMDLTDLELSTAIFGIPLIPNVDLVESHRGEINWGYFFLQDTDPNGGDYVRDDLGARLQLVHFTAEDYAEFLVNDEE